LEFDMMFFRKLAVSTVAGFAALAAGAALADETATTIEVGLWDMPGMAMMTGLGHGMGGMMKHASMGITLSVAEVPAGEVTFSGTNLSKTMEHEMIVAMLAASGEVLPYDTAEDSVDEDAANALGEIEELEPGKSGTLTLHLDPGAYILFCNIPGHYMSGMWTVLTVK
jgi:uncharacterized cupredoxin-like copper-binding protein